MSSYSYFPDNVHLHLDFRPNCNSPSTLPYSDFPTLPYLFLALPLSSELRIQRKYLERPFTIININSLYSFNNPYSKSSQGALNSCSCASFSRQTTSLSHNLLSSFENAIPKLALSQKMQVSIPSNQMQVPTKQSSQRYSFAADNSEDMDIDPFVVVEPMRPEQMHVRQFRRHEDTSVTPTIQSASFPTGVTTPGPTPSCTPVEHEVSFLTQHQQQQQQAQAQLQVQQKYQQSGFDIGFGSSEISLADTLTFGTGALGLTSPLTRKTAKDQEIRIDPHSMNNLTPGSPKKPPNSHRNSFGRAAHLPFLNLSAVKHYTGWPGSPIKPPTPLAQPPTPLTHPTGAIYVHDGHHHQQQSPHHRQHQYQHQAHDTPTHPSVGTFLPLTGAMIGISGGESSGSGSHVDLHKGKQISAVKMVRTDANTMRPLSPVDGKGARPLSRVFEQQQQPALHHPQPPRPQSRRLQQQPQHQLQQNQQQAVGTLRPFALPPNQAQQYMSFNLDESSPSPSPTLGETPISPPLTPGVPEGQQTVQAHAGSPLQCLPQVQRVVPQAVSKLAPPSLKVCTPPTKIVSTPSGLVANGTEVATAGNSPSPSPVSTENIIPPGLQAKAAPKSNSIPTVAEFLAGGTVSTILEQQYQLLDELGAGGFGFVLRAKRKVDGLIVAIKFIFRERVCSEATRPLVKYENFLTLLIYLLVDPLSRLGENTKLD